MMKDHREAPPPPATMNGKSKIMEEEADGGVDKLLAALSYKVQSSDMANVARMLEQLDMVMGTSAAQDDAVLLHLASDTIHYNLSNLSMWLESMLSELNAPPPPLPPRPTPSHPKPFEFTTSSSSSIFASLAAAESSTVTTDFKPFYGSNLASAASTVGFDRDQKRMRTMNNSSSSSSSRGIYRVTLRSSTEPAAPMVTEVSLTADRMVEVLHPPVGGNDPDSLGGGCRH